MPSDNDQESLWEQSDLLQLMASGAGKPATGAPPSRRPPAEADARGATAQGRGPVVHGGNNGDGGLTTASAESMAAPASARTIGRAEDPNASREAAQETIEPTRVPEAPPATGPLVPDPASRHRPAGDDGQAAAGMGPAGAAGDRADLEATGQSGPVAGLPLTGRPDAAAAPAEPQPAPEPEPEPINAGAPGLPEPTTAADSPAGRLSLASPGKPGPAGPTLLAKAAASDGDALPACPQRLLILDTETTALSPEQGQCIEVGAVLFDVASRAVLMQVSFLLPCAHNAAEHVNGIPAAVSRLSQPWQQGLACFEAMVASAEAVLAHNAGFDRQWFGHGELPLLERPWICSMEDIRWPAERHLRPNPSVRDLALAYGVPVWEAHRALTDCIYLVQVFQRCEALETLLREALEPRRLVRARLSYDERQLAKDAGFRWNEPVPKAWSRRLSEREIAALRFPVDPVEADQDGGGGRQPESSRWRRSA